MQPIRLPKRDFSIERGAFALEGLDFDIHFCESILKTHPDHVDSLRFLGSAYTARGEHERGLDIDLRLLELEPNDPIVHYNLGCSYSLLGRIGDAVAALERAIELGYRDFEHMERDEDLDTVRADRRYTRLLSKLGVRPVKHFG